MDDDAKRYEIRCPYCGSVQYACKSVLQESGINMGHGTCIDCRQLMKLDFDYEKDAMAAGKFKQGFV